MAIMYEHIAAQRDSGVVIYTACTICYVAHNDRESVREADLH